MMNRRQLKRAVTTILQGPELGEVFQGLECFSPKQLINPLFSCLCHPDEIVRWHAVSAFGLAVPALAEQEMEGGRIIMRRFLWMLNDESGGIGWGVPEALGEVMFHHELLAQEYIHMLVSYTLDDGPELYQDGNFLELPQLQQGVLWGLCRVAPKYSDFSALCRVKENLGCYFSSMDHHVRGLVCLLSGLLGLSEFQTALSDLVTDSAEIRLYQEGMFRHETVGSLADKAIYMLECR